MTIIYQSPRKQRSFPLDSWTTLGPPRDYREWAALRRWGKLPAPEREVPGYLLRMAREGAGLTQAALAARLGIAQQTVAQAERWITNPTVAFMKRWAKACGAEVRIELGSW